MKLQDLFENDKDGEHFAALRKTGFFGAAGAGCVIFAKDTRRFLIAHRSRAVEQPNTFGTWGGAIDSGENPVEAVKREVREETGYNSDFKIDPLFVFKKENFRYYNYLVTVDHEFTPRLDWENQGYKWCEFDKWPSPLHFGLVSLLNDPESYTKMQQAAQQ
jgi:8-oxo-dGTP pyrophosphatase MutT (NUDIX family)